MLRSIPRFATALFCTTAAAAQTASSPPPETTDASSSAEPSNLAPVAIVAPSEAADPLRVPGPGRVPLIVESVGGRQSVGLTIGNTSIARDDLCFTPCTLFVPPSEVTLVTYGPGIAETETDITIGQHGLRVRMRAPSESRLAAGRALTILGILAGVAGAVTLITGAAELGNAHGASTPLEMVIAGSISFGVGVGMLIPGLVFVGNTQGGVEASGPVARRRVSPVRFGLAPGPTGVYATGTFVF